MPLVLFYDLNTKSTCKQAQAEALLKQLLKEGDRADIPISPEDGRPQRPQHQKKSSKYY